jgi:sterol 14-demethylase
MLEANSCIRLLSVEQLGIGVVVAAGVISLIVLFSLLSVLNQLLFKNPNEPPVIFHWFPIIGSTLSYGTDPYEFFKKCRTEVSRYQAYIAEHG